MTATPSSYYVYVSHEPNGLTADMGPRDYIEAAEAAEAAEAYADQFRELAPAEDWSGWVVTARLLDESGGAVPCFDDNTDQWARATI